MTLGEIGNTIRAVPAGILDRYGRDLAVFLFSSLVFGAIASIIVYKHLSSEPAQLTIVEATQPTSVPTTTPVPTSITEVSQESTPENAKVSDGKVNINTATAAELDALPGIGPAYAQRIIDARPFSSAASIVRVSGIGPKIYENLKDLITIE